MLSQDLFESSPGSMGQSALQQLQNIASSGQNGNLKIGVEMMPIQSWQATYLLGVYKSLNQKYGPDKALSMMGNYDFVDYALSKQEQKLANISRVGSVPGERGVSEGNGDPDIRPGMKTQHGTVVSVQGNTVTVKASNGELTTVNIHDLEKSAEPVSENMSIGKQMARDGITYSPEKEKELIGLMGDYMKRNGMSERQIRYYLNYDEDFVPDQLSDLPRATPGVSEASTTGVLWRVHQPRGQGGYSQRYYVVKGHGKDMKIWKNKIGAGDFINKADAEAKAQELNQGVEEGIRDWFSKSKEQEPAGPEMVLYVVNPDNTYTYANVLDAEHLAKLQQKYRDRKQQVLDYRRPDVKSWLDSRGVSLGMFRPGNEVTIRGRDISEANPSVEEEVKLPYPEGSEKLGLANMSILIKAYNEPTSPRVKLQFGDKVIDLDREDIQAIADYYDDRLPTNDARWNFIRAVMNNYDNFVDVLHKIGRRSARSVKQPGLFQEADKKKDDEDLTAVKDVGLQRAISKAKADFPTAGSGIEALAKDFMKSQEQDRKEFDSLQAAKQKHDSLLNKIAKIDQEQEQEIDNLENQNSVLSQRVQQLQNVNVELEKMLASMTGRKQKSPAPAPRAAAAADTVKPVDIKAPAKSKVKQPPAPKKTAVKKPRPSLAISRVASQLAEPTPSVPQLPRPDGEVVFPPSFRRPTDSAYQKSKELATDTEFKEFPFAKPEPVAAESKKSGREADYDADYQDMVRRLGKLAKEGPRKTVWDPVKRVYKTVPINPSKKDDSTTEISNEQAYHDEYDAIKTVSDWAEKLRVARELQKDIKLMADPEAKSAVQQRIVDLLNYGIKQGYMK